MDESILTSIKAALGLQDDYTAFDFEITMHINSALASLHQIGVGPTGGFAISDKTAVWSDFLEGNERINNAKEYVYLRVRNIFDPPATPHLLNAFEARIDEAAWRLQAETDPMIPWEQPELTEDEDEVLILDGGSF